jgi:hypothetical protein
MLNVFESLPDALISGLVFLLGLFGAFWWGRITSTPFSRVLLLYIWHSVFCVFYFYYSLTNTADTTSYYAWSLEPVSFGLGTDFVVLILSIFSQTLGFGYLPSFLVFNIIGSFGLFAFYSALRHAATDSRLWVRRLVLVIVLLPSVSFWSVAIGKDAIAFMASGLALWAAIDLKKRNLLMVFAISIMFMIRPHIGGLMVLALVISYVFEGHRSLINRLLLVIFGAGVAVVAVPFSIDYAGLNQVNLAAVGAYIEQRQSYNQDGGGGVDISSMSLPMQLFTYLFRPLPFEARSVFQLAASLDNLIFLVVFLLGVFSWRARKQHSKNVNNMFLFAFSISCWIVLSLTTANLGISVRQKWMFSPMVFYLLISVLGRPQENIASKHLR